MIGKYRIYPSWFGKSDKIDPINELAQRGARRLGLRVVTITIASSGRDDRGEYFDFNVTYGSTAHRDPIVAV